MLIGLRTVVNRVAQKGLLGRELPAPHDPLRASEHRVNWMLAEADCTISSPLPQASTHSF
jgi:hypothetical protein